MARRLHAVVHAGLYQFRVSPWWDVADGVLVHYCCTYSSVNKRNKRRNGSHYALTGREGGSSLLLVLTWLAPPHLQTSQNLSSSQGKKKRKQALLYDTYLPFLPHTPRAYPPAEHPLTMGNLRARVSKYMRIWGYTILWKRASLVSYIRYMHI